MKKLIVIGLLIFAGCNQFKMAPPPNPDDDFTVEDLNQSELNISSVLVKPLLFARSKKSIPMHPSGAPPANDGDRFTPNDLDRNSTKKEDETQPIQPKKEQEK